MENTVVLKTNLCLTKQMCLSWRHHEIRNNIVKTSITVIPPYDYITHYKLHTIVTLSMPVIPLYLYIIEKVCVSVFVRHKILRVGPKGFCGALRGKHGQPWAGLHAVKYNKHYKLHTRVENIVLVISPYNYTHNYLPPCNIGIR